MSKRYRSSKGENSKKARNDIRPVGVNLEQLSLTSYYFENGHRKVFPYYFTFQTNCKGRWIGRKLIDVYRSEFRLYTSEEYVRKITRGHLRVNSQHVSLNHILKNGDLLESLVHRHETPVNAQPDIQIVVNDDEVVVIDKPCSIPVHPCGNFRYNSLLFILAKEHGINSLYSVHRIDRLTSGLIIFAKTSLALQRIQGDILNKVAHKEYLCLAEGIFPKRPLVCEEPIKIHSFKIGISAVSHEPDSKPCTTSFERLAVIYKPPTLPTTNDQSKPDLRIEASGRFISLVRCTPLTGRTHQIRVHAQYLGHPIINDPLYNTVLGWGPKKGRGGEYGKPLQDVIKDLIVNGHHEHLNSASGSEDHRDAPKMVKEELTPFQTAVVRAITNQRAASVGDPLVSEESRDINVSTSTPHIIHNGSDRPIANATATAHDESFPPTGNLTAEVNAALDMLAASPDKFLSWFDEECEDCHIILKCKLESSFTPNSSDDPSPEGRVEGDLRYATVSRPFVDPSKHGNELPMYLHCYRYAGQDWSYQTTLPPWAAPETTFRQSCVVSSRTLVDHPEIVNLEPDDTVYIDDDCREKEVISIYPDNYNPLLRHLTKNN